MLASQLIREARRRGGLSQAEMARRLATTQSVIARLEAGKTEPSLERVREIVEAAGLTLRFELVNADVNSADWAAIARNLTLGPEERWDKAVASARFVQAGRRAPSRR
ncbi:MAG TPA: helix-turn-helix domain-containing protein [Acidimicrobiales bacterium]